MGQLLSYEVMSQNLIEKLEFSSSLQYVFLYWIFGDMIYNFFTIWLLPNRDVHVVKMISIYSVRKQTV